jgi:hypothetical protein
VAVIVVRMLSPRGLRDGSGMKTDYARL